jgi:integrase
MAQGQPGPHAQVFPRLDGNSFRLAEWARICGKHGAGIGHRLIKDLRDSYASHLLSSGIVLAFVARQLGHTKTTVTERHYAKYLPDGDV